MADEKKPEKAKKPSRMYAEGRTIGKGEDGKPKMVETKAEKANAKEGEEAGRDARHLEDQHEMHKRHKKEMTDMHGRHEAEFATMIKRHESEGA